MRIAVFGWYGHNNAGDERIKYCLNQFLTSVGGISCVDFFDLHENAVGGATNKFDCYDLVIIGGGGLILSRCNYHNFILGINTKMVTLGISVETELKGNPKKFALALLKKSLVVLVRDNESAFKLNGLGVENRARVSSDLTFLVPYDAVKIEGNQTVGLNFLPKPKNFKYSTLSNPHLSFVLRQFIRIGFPNILKVIDFTDIVTGIESRYSTAPIPLYSDPKDPNAPIYQKNDVEFLKLYFDKVPNVFMHHHIDKCDVFLSMRLHGSIFSVQKGVPVISFTYLPKNRNFMREAGLEDFVVDSMDPKVVLKLIEKSMRVQAMLKEKMSLFTQESSKKINNDLVDMLNRVK